MPETRFTTNSRLTSFIAYDYVITYPHLDWPQFTHFLQPS